MALKDKGMASFRIDEPMLSLKPFRLVFHLAQDQSRRHPSQSMCWTQNRNMRGISPYIDIRLIFSRSPFGHKAGRKRRAARSVDLIEPYLGESSLKLVERKSRIVNHVHRDLALRLS